MSAPPKSGGEPITDKRQLVQWIASGNKPPKQWRIGTEHEKFAFRLADRRRLPYDGPDGIEALLKGMMRFGWQGVEEAGKVIALTRPEGGSVTLEPGGQVELSGRTVATIHDTCNEVHEHLDQVKEVGHELGIGMIGLGFDPKWRRDEVPWMPKGRYRIMRDYMPKKGGLGLDMMLRTCTVQTNLDFESEADMALKFRVSLALQPVATALFANSPFVEGKPSGYLSLRSHVWTDTDPDRCGVPPFVFERGFGFERYADYLLDVPMYFVYRDGKYIDASGQSFRDFMKGRLPALPGEIPTINDWADHATTVFPEVRLKKYLEMRGADGGPWRRLCALPALWVGLLYDKGALAQAAELVKDWTLADHAYLRAEVPRAALKTGFAKAGGGGTVRELALTTLAIAKEGLRRRAKGELGCPDESCFLETLFEIADSGETPAERLLARYRGAWGGSVDPVFQEYAY
jgi:glutamate--cysteine ligase